jgi:hypothetical protein
MLLGNFFLLFSFSSNILVFLLGLGKTDKKTVENSKEFVTLTCGRILAEQFADSVELKEN